MSVVVWISGASSGITIAQRELRRWEQSGEPALATVVACDGRRTHRPHGHRHGRLARHRASRSPRRCSQRGARVVMTSRTAESAEAAAAELDPEFAAGYARPRGRRGGRRRAASRSRSSASAASTSSSTTPASTRRPARSSTRTTRASPRRSTPTSGRRSCGPGGLARVDGRARRDRHQHRLARRAYRQPEPRHLPRHQGRADPPHQAARARARAAGPRQRRRAGHRPHPALGAALADHEDEVAGLTPLGRIGVPADVGSAVAFLASDQASWITGETLVIDGGQLLQLAQAEAEQRGMSATAVVGLEPAVVTPWIPRPGARRAGTASLRPRGRREVEPDLPGLRCRGRALDPPPCARRAAANGTTYDETYAQYARETPLRRLIPPEDIAATAVFLASDAAASITGEDVNVSGGLAMFDQRRPCDQLDQEPRGVRR